jgi:hypothetical protein
VYSDLRLAQDGIVIWKSLTTRGKYGDVVRLEVWSTTECPSKEALGRHSSSAVDRLRIMS